MSDDPLDRRFKASEGTRTPDPLITNQPLYLLSYAGVPSPVNRLFRRARVEVQGKS
jgi:hypothetical protein